MTPFLNVQNTDSSKEWFNYFHSQRRIVVERVIGVLMRRWGIFWKPLEFDLVNIFEVVHACCRLHNFCNSRRSHFLANTSTRNPPSYVALDENGALVNMHFRAAPPSEGLQRGNAMPVNVVREQILGDIEANQYRARRNYN